MKELMERVRLSENVASRVQVIYCRFEGVVIRRYRHVSFGDMSDHSIGYLSNGVLVLRALLLPVMN